jgi:hypothetical protein
MDPSPSRIDEGVRGWLAEMDPSPFRIDEGVRGWLAEMDPSPPRIDEGVWGWLAEMSPSPSRIDEGAWDWLVEANPPQHRIGEGARVRLAERNPPRSQIHESVWDLRVELSLNLSRKGVQEAKINPYQTDEDVLAKTRQDWPAETNPSQCGTEVAGMGEAKGQREWDGDHDHPSNICPLWGTGRRRTGTETNTNDVSRRPSAQYTSKACK